METARRDSQICHQRANILLRLEPNRGPRMGHSDWHRLVKRELKGEVKSEVGNCRVAQERNGDRAKTESGTKVAQIKEQVFSGDDPFGGLVK